MRWDYLLADLSYWWSVIIQTRTYALLKGSWELFSNIWLYFFASLALAALLVTYVSPTQLVNALRKLKTWSIPIASFLGLISPLGTYSVIPLAALLISIGVPLGPIIAFTVSSPLMNPSIFLLTAGGLSLNMAIARCVATLILSSLAGLIAMQMEKHWKGPEHYVRANDNLKAKLKLHHHRKSIEGLKSGKYEKIIEGEEPSRHPWLHNFLVQIRFAGKYMLLAVFISSAVNTFVPAPTVQSVMSIPNNFSIVIAALVGIPMYTCGGAAIPLMQVLTGMGMTKGAVLAFFITGPATNLSTIFTMSVLFRPKVNVLYYSVTFLGAVLLGSLYQLL
jgi:uncharacterized membrane protein YraQ (UPF0718 family)